jgi:hypothetical protein
VTILSESGVPTPVVDTRISPPLSRTAPADDVDGAAKASALWPKYGERVDNQSAREMLAARMQQAAPAAAPTLVQPGGQPATTVAEEHRVAAEAAGGGVGAVTAFLKSKEGKQLQKQVVRGVFGLLKKKF